MKYCSLCGSTVKFTVPDQDNMTRAVCSSCNNVFYESPRICVVTIPLWEEKILLCRRAIEPRRGFWCLPGGYLEKGETLEEGARREVLEETNADVEIIRLFTKTEILHIGLIMFCFLGRLRSPDCSAGMETLEVGLFEAHEIPGQKLAFEAHQFSLNCYLEDKENLEVRSISIHQDSPEA